MFSSAPLLELPLPLNPLADMALLEPTPPWRLRFRLMPPVAEEAPEAEPDPDDADEVMGELPGSEETERKNDDQREVVRSRFLVQMKQI